MGLQRFEQGLERLVEGAFARGLRGGLQPVEIGRRLTREMDLMRRVGVRGLTAPNAFVVTLSAADAARFDSFLDALARELGDAAREHARAEGYEFLGPVEVELQSDDALKPGRYTVRAEMREGTMGLSAASVILPDGSRIPLDAEPIVVGRMPECTVVLSDPNVSRRHAEIRRSGSDVVAVDLQSTNGTRVNGIPIRERVLADGDDITVGTTILRFQTS